MIKAQLVALVAVILACAPASVSGAVAVKRASTCNGYSDLCSRQYSNVTYIGTHDSYAVGSTSSLSSNQELTVKDQLQSGIRALQIQGHKDSDGGSGSGISLCHTSCKLQNGGTLEQYLSNVTDWVKSNPNDVISIFIANNDNLPASQWDKGFSSSGLRDYVYSPGTEKLSKKDWPTLQDMINKKQRVVVYMDYKANTNQVKYILPEYKNVWEDPYDQKKTPFNCTADRFDGDSDQMMYLHNHFLDKEKNIFGKSFPTPDVDQIDSTNSVNTILSNTGKCAKQHGNYPTFVLVDFFNKGNGSVFEAAARMNNVKYQGSEISTSNTDSKQHGNGAASMRPTTLGSLSSAVLLLAVGLLF